MGGDKGCGGGKQIGPDCGSGKDKSGKSGTRSATSFQGKSGKDDQKGKGSKDDEGKGRRMTRARAASQPVGQRHDNLKCRDIDCNSEEFNVWVNQTYGRVEVRCLVCGTTRWAN